MDNNSYSDVTSTAYLMPGNSSQAEVCLVDRDDAISAMKMVVTVASSLSIICALFIILVSYCKQEKKKELTNNTGEALGETAGFQNSLRLTDLDESIATDPDLRKEERNEKEAVKHPARLIIVCMSAADILVAISHIWGVSNNYAPLQDTSIAYSYDHHGEHFWNSSVPPESTYIECGAQAVLAIFGTISSFLWTDLLALMAVVMLRSSSNKYFKPTNFTSYRAFVIYNTVCWGIPLLVTCILGGKNAIGFEEGVDVGWCYIHAHYDKKGLRLWWMFFSYELWVSGSMLWIILLVLLFCIMFYAEKIQKRRYKDTIPADEQRQPLIEPVVVEEAKITHCKICCGNYKCSKPLIMIIAAGFLIVCRIWATFLDFLLFRSITNRSNFHCTLTNLIILTFAGFGNSCQGLVNFIIFYGFTGQCCKALCSLCSNCCKKQRPIV